MFYSLNICGVQFLLRLVVAQVVRSEAEGSGASVDFFFLIWVVAQVNNLLDKYPVVGRISRICARYL